MEEQAYTLRELQADDLYGMIRIVNKIGLEEMQQCFEGDELRKTMRENGSAEDAEKAMGLQVINVFHMEGFADFFTELFRSRA